MGAPSAALRQTGLPFIHGAPGAPFKFFKRKPMPSYQRILETEDANEDKIYLYKAGKFWKAYNQSAYLFHTFIQSFKLSSRVIQKLNRRVVSLGFPEGALKKYTYNFLVEKVDEDCLRVHLGKRVDESAFDHWMEMAFLQGSTAPQYTPSTTMIEHQPVYKTAYDLLTQIYQCAEGLSKNVRNPLGLRAKELSYEIAYGIRMLYDVPDRSSHVAHLQARCKELMFALQLMTDLPGGLSKKAFALASERIVSVSGQLEGLRRKATADKGKRGTKLIQQPTGTLWEQSAEDDLPED